MNIPHLKKFLSNKMCIRKLAYLPDIFSRLNDLNSSLQGYSINIFSVCNKTNGFKRSNKEKI